jgi:DNA-binding NtrC family response regulator
MIMERWPWIGEDPASQKLFELAQRASPVPTTILITGESGTGKNYLARLIHEVGPRRDAPFVRVDCESLPAAQVESELFGHERGGMPGAAERKTGALELAKKGTVVLDEVAALSMGTQTKLLRAMELRKMERIGGKETAAMEARVVALTHADMNAGVKEGRIREALYFRLDLLKMWIPPLRERPGDILPLAQHFLAVIGARHGKQNLELGEKAKEVLKACRWPGNVRQLREAVERAVLTTANSQLEPEDFPAEVRTEAGGGSGENGQRSLEDLEREGILATLESTQYRIGRSAEILGISRKTLLEKRKKYGLK